MTWTRVKTADGTDYQSGEYRLTWCWSSKYGNGGKKLWSVEFHGMRFDKRHWSLRGAKRHAEMHAAKQTAPA